MGNPFTNPSNKKNKEGAGPSPLLLSNLFAPKGEGGKKYSLLSSRTWSHAERKGEGMFKTSSTSPEKGGEKKKEKSSACSFCISVQGRLSADAQERERRGGKEDHHAGAHFLPC